MKLTPAQQKAMAKLTREWQSAYRLGFSRNTLDALVRRGLAEHRAETGYLFFPTIGNKYRLKETK